MQSAPKQKVMVRVIQAGALTLFAAATIWINYEIKVHVQGGRGGGSVNEMGNVKVGQVAPDFSTLDFIVLMLLLARWRFRVKEVC